MNRFGESRELIGAAVFLAAEKASSFITGTDILVDGGVVAEGGGRSAAGRITEGGAPVDAAAKVGIFTTSIGALTTLAGYYMGVRAADRAVERVAELSISQGEAWDDILRMRRRLADYVRFTSVIDVEPSQPEEER